MRFRNKNSQKGKDTPARGTGMCMRFRGSKKDCEDQEACFYSGGLLGTGFGKSWMTDLPAGTCAPKIDHIQDLFEKLCAEMKKRFQGHASRVIEDLISLGWIEETVQDQNSNCEILASFLVGPRALKISESQFTPDQRDALFVLTERKINVDEMEPKKALESAFEEVFGKPKTPRSRFSKKILFLTAAVMVSYYLSQMQGNQNPRKPVVESSITDQKVPETSLINPPLETSLINPPLETSLINTPLETSLINTPLETSLINPPLETSLINPPLETSLINRTPEISVSPWSPMRPTLSLGPLARDYDSHSVYQLGGVSAHNALSSTREYTIWGGILEPIYNNVFNILSLNQILSLYEILDSGVTSVKMPVNDRGFVFHGGLNKIAQGWLGNYNKTTLEVLDMISDYLDKHPHRYLMLQFDTENKDALHKLKEAIDRSKIRSKVWNPLEHGYQRRSVSRELQEGIQVQIHVEKISGYNGQEITEFLSECPYCIPLGVVSTVLDYEQPSYVGDACVRRGGEDFSPVIKDYYKQAHKGNVIRDLDGEPVNFTLVTGQTAMPGNMEASHKAASPEALLKVAQKCSASVEKMVVSMDFVTPRSVKEVLTTLGRGEDQIDFVQNTQITPPEIVIDNLFGNSRFSDSLGDVVNFLNEGSGGPTDVMTAIVGIVSSIATVLQLGFWGPKVVKWGYETVWGYLTSQEVSNLISSLDSSASALRNQVKFLMSFLTSRSCNSKQRFTRKEFQDLYDLKTTLPTFSPARICESNVRHAIIAFLQRNPLSSLNEIHEFLTGLFQVEGSGSARGTLRSVLQDVLKTLLEEEDLIMHRDMQRFVYLPRRALNFMLTSLDL